MVDINSKLKESEVVAKNDHILTSVSKIIPIA
jgi:hypothetical protein